jgi:hypothetical protein
MSSGGLSAQVRERICANRAAALARAQARGVTPVGDVLLLSPSSPLRVSPAAPTAVAALGGREELLGADVLQQERARARAAELAVHTAREASRSAEAALAQALERERAAVARAEGAEAREVELDDEMAQVELARDRLASDAAAREDELAGTKLELADTKLRAERAEAAVFDRATELQAARADLEDGTSVVEPSPLAAAADATPPRSRRRKHRRRGRGGKGATAASAAAVVIQSLSQPTAPAAAGSSVSGGVSAPGERGCGAGHRLESKVADVEEFLRSVRCAATQARPSAQRGIFSRGIGQSVASLKDAARLESRRAARRAQDKRVTKVRAAREAKQWRRHHSRQHNQGRSADGSFHRGAKRKRGNGKNHDADRRAAQSRGYRR